MRDQLGTFAGRTEGYEHSNMRPLIQPAQLDVLLSSTLDLHTTPLHEACKGKKRWWVDH